MVDEQHWCCIGGDADAVLGRLNDGWSADLDRDDAVRLAVSALAGPERSLAAEDLEVAVLSAGSGRRCFKRLEDNETESLLA
mgnify:FL=1